MRSDVPIVAINCSPKYKEYRDALVSHLGVLKSAGLIELWTEDQISVGVNREQEINRVIAKTSIAILLITADFLTSDFILKEGPNLLERQDREDIIIFPVLARACPWETIEWLAQIQIRPKSGEAIWKTGSDVDEALAAIAMEVHDIVVKGLKSTTLIQNKGLEVLGRKENPEYDDIKTALEEQEGSESLSIHEFEALASTVKVTSGIDTTEQAPLHAKVQILGNFESYTLVEITDNQGNTVIPTKKNTYVLSQRQPYHLKASIQSLDSLTTIFNSIRLIKGQEIEYVNFTISLECDSLILEPNEVKFVVRAKQKAETNIKTIDIIPTAGNHTIFFQITQIEYHCSNLLTKMDSAAIESVV